MSGMKRVRGPANPVYIPDEDQIIVNGITSVAGDNVLVAAPGLHRRIVVTSFILQNESQTANVMVLQNGAAGRGWRFNGSALGVLLAMTLPVGREWRLSDNTPLVLDLGGATQVGYTVHYYIGRM